MLCLAYTPCTSILLLALMAAPITDRAAPDPSHGLRSIRVSDDAKHFVFSDSGKRFTPWGFNYDHDGSNRLLESYWSDEWPQVVADFEEMKALGANTVRIHLQIARFMRSAAEPNEESLALLTRLLQLAERTGLYLDLTGLGCYDKTEVPEWYDQLGESGRWAVQARFWEAVAEVGRSSRAIFCYDLMNEPIVTEDKQKRDWTPGAFGNRYFVQRLTLDFAGRTPKEIARAWVNQMTTAIRKQDPHRLITVGAIPWALTWPTAKPLFYSPEVSKNLDFVSLHFYPKSGELDKALDALAVYNIGKPIIIEEMFPLNCSVAELDQFIDRSQPIATGWIGFYWGKTREEYESSPKGISEAITLDWLNFFVRKTPAILSQYP